MEQTYQLQHLVTNFFDGRRESDDQLCTIVDIQKGWFAGRVLDSLHVFKL